ncbi:MAG: HAD-IA family hydrolase [Treponema sp.]|nr:HAD-IA family hydrolase [Treponema sp.]
MKFDGVILDIDGTIWNTTEIVAAAWNKAIKSCHYNTEVTADILKKEFGKTMEIIADDLFPFINSSEKKLLFKKCYEEEQRALRKNTKKIEYAGVFETIKKSAATHRIFIVSNCQKGYIELVMDKIGITSFISDYECFGNTGKGKCFNMLDVIRRNSIANPVYIGDTQGDSDACKEAGVPFIWASYGFGKPDSYYAAVKSFSDIEYLI